MGVAVNIALGDIIPHSVIAVDVRREAALHEILQHIVFRPLDVHPQQTNPVLQNDVPFAQPVLEPHGLHVFKRIRRPVKRVPGSTPAVMIEPNLALRRRRIA